MTRQRTAQIPSSTAPRWDDIRWVREPIAWTFLAVSAVAVLGSGWELLGLPGSPAFPTPGPTPGPVPHVTFAIRASVVAPQFVEGGLFMLPLLAVVLVAFAGGLTARARSVVQGAVAVQGLTLGLGVLTWLGAASDNLRHGVWFVFDGADLVAVAAALLFSVAVLRSAALRLHPSE